MKNIYYICSHFTNLVEYHELCLFFHEFFPEIKQHLVLIEHHYFSLVKYEHFLEGFNSVTRLPACECAFTNRWYFELLPWTVFKRLAKVRTFIKEKNNFTFQDDSLCIISELTEATLPVRLLLKKFHVETEYSKVCRVGTCYRRSSEHSTNNWLSWLLHNVYVLIGAYPVSVYFHSWMVTERRYYNEKEIIDFFLVFSNKFEKHDEFTEIKFPLIENKQSRTQDKEYVFFFDNGLGWTYTISEISVEQWIATMNRILQALSDLYKNEKVVLLLKPHPANKGNIPYDLSGFEVYSKDDTAEMIFSSCKERIRAVYSITSTAARSASLYRINSYVFYEMFNFPDEMMSRLKRYLLDFSDVINIKNLDTLRLPQSVLPQPNAEDLEEIEEIFKRI